MVFFLEIRVAADIPQCATNMAPVASRHATSQLQGWAGEVEGINNGALVVTHDKRNLLKKE